MTPVSRRGLLASAAATACAGCAAVPHRVVPVDRFDDTPFNVLVQKHAPAGRVAYAAWKADRADMDALENLVGNVAAVSPENRPELFPSREAALAYWCTAYNAWTVKLVLDAWPLRSVMDVKRGPAGWLKAGAGFFWETRIVLGGRTTNLYDLEHDVIRKLDEPRVHFAINCASNSCPTLRPWRWTSQNLDRATRAFVNDAKRVRVDGNTILVNPILDWFAADFGDVHAFLQRHAEGDLGAVLARTPRVRMRFMDYDWGINAA